MMMAVSATNNANGRTPTVLSGSDVTGPPIIDVWSRTHPKYRIRAIVLLAINVLLFAGVGSFAYWLRSGEWFAPSTEGYWDQLEYTFAGVGHADVSLGSLLLDPINVEDVPMQIPILGLLMSALISIPILVAILYRFWSSLPFIAVVGLLAVMPWLAITLLASCLIASVRPFKTQFRFVSALAGLAPCVVYFILAWSGSTEIIVGKIDPVERIKFVAPWVLAIVAASVAFALVLTIARIVDYRPGAITPLLAVMFGLPVALFEANVGRDELYYRVLESLDHANFTDVDASQPLQEAARLKWEMHPSPKPSWESVQELEAEKWLFELATDLRPFQSELTKHQVEITSRCDWFLKHFPDSRYAVNALYLKAQALDTRVDTVAFRQTRWIRFYDDFPSSTSEDTWRLIYENAPDSHAGMAAALRLAQIEARDGNIDRALDRLRSLLRTAPAPKGGEEATETGAGALRRALARGAAEESLGISMDRVVIEATRLRDLLAENRDPIYGYDPLSGTHINGDERSFGLLDLDARHDRYRDNLHTLKRWYPDCQIEDNIDLELAKCAVSLPTRIARLQEIVARFAGRDAVPEALLRLAMAYRDNNQPEQSEETFADLMKRYPNTIWTIQAARLAPPRAWTRLSGTAGSMAP